MKSTHPIGIANPSSAAQPNNSIIANAFDDQKFYPDFKITFKLSGKDVLLHRFIAESIISVETIPKNDIINNNHFIMDIKSNHEPTMYNLLRSAYTGVLTLTDHNDQIVDALNLCTRYQMQSRLTLLADFISNEADVTTDTMISCLLWIAEHNSHIILHSIQKCFARLEVSDKIHDVKFDLVQRLDSLTLGYFLVSFSNGRDKIKERSNAFSWIKSWIDANVEHRKHLCYDLLDIVDKCHNSSEDFDGIKYVKSMFGHPEQEIEINQDQVNQPTEETIQDDDEDKVPALSSSIFMNDFVNDSNIQDVESDGEDFEDCRDQLLTDSMSQSTTSTEQSKKVSLFDSLVLNHFTDRSEPDLLRSVHVTNDQGKEKSHKVVVTTSGRVVPLNKCDKKRVTFTIQHPKVHFDETKKLNSS
ncbi:iolA1 [Acrasis kona]|uniref:IolA1 n=1 Tax=Acrasis kona TaxID=1008807 RepID=A0AAW2ZDD0_9EUKA